MLSSRYDKLPSAAPIRAALVFWFAATLIAVSGCGEDETAEIAPRATFDADLKAPSVIVSSDPGVRPVITSDVTSIDAWLDLVRRFKVGDTIPADGFQELLETPAYRMIDDERKRNNLDRRIMKRVMEDVFANREGLEARAPKRPDLHDNFTYLRDHLNEAAAFNHDFCTPALLNDLRDALAAFIPPEDLPAGISIHFFAGTPLIGFTEPDKFAMDMGLALAAGQEQTVKLLASRLYVVLSPADSVEPDVNQDGAVKLAAAFRLLRRHAIAGWLGDKASIRFDDTHELLRGEALHAPVLQEDAILILKRTTTMMKNMLDPVVVFNQDKYGGKIHNLLHLNDRYEKIGWAMARLIADHFGEDELRNVSDDTVAFMHAYQTAALASASSGELHGLPPFPASMFANLITHLSTH